MFNVTQLAQETMERLAPLWIAAKALVGDAEEGAAREAGKKIFDWLLERFKGKPAHAVLIDAEAEPSEQRLRYLKRAIEDAADGDETFRDRLAELLTANKQAVQVAQIDGDSGRIVQNSGDQNRISVK